MRYQMARITSLLRKSTQLRSTHMISAPNHDAFHDLCCLDQPEGVTCFSNTLSQKSFSLRIIGGKLLLGINPMNKGIIPAGFW